jgi:hypothetical protein
MRFIVAITAGLLVTSLPHSELMHVDVTIIKTKLGGWSYRTSDSKELASDKELAKYLKDLSNPFDGIWLTIQSECDVPIDQLTKILGMVKKNRQGITLKRILLGRKGFDWPK